jgi:hypothetical protein
MKNLFILTIVILQASFYQIANGQVRPNTITQPTVTPDALPYSLPSSSIVNSIKTITPKYPAYENGMSIDKKH